VAQPAPKTPASVKQDDKGKRNGTTDDGRGTGDRGRSGGHEAGDKGHSGDGDGHGDDHEHEPGDKPTPSCAAPGPGSGTKPSTRATSRTATEYVDVCVPAVMFQKKLVVRGGRLRTAVLVAASGRTGRAFVAGMGACHVDLRAGVVAWLDCPYRRTADTITVRVRLSDHRVVTFTARPTFA
jgi:hypothetical protein